MGDPSTSKTGSKKSRARTLRDVDRSNRHKPPEVQDFLIAERRPGVGTRCRAIIGPTVLSEGCFSVAPRDLVQITMAITQKSTLSWSELGINKSILTD